ncbi:MAG: hypothetical protein ACR2L2_17690 [Acidobacteriota bacterium]
MSAFRWMAVEMAQEFSTVVNFSVENLGGVSSQRRSRNPDSNQNNTLKRIEHDQNNEGMFL